MTIELSVERAMELLREVVAEYGEDFVYQRADISGPADVACAYERDGKPSCLIGHVLHRAGWTVDQLKSLDSSDYHYTDIATAANNGHIALAQEVTELLRQAQSLQDLGESWGAALSAAEEEYATLKEVA